MLVDEIDGVLKDVRFSFLRPPLILGMMQGKPYRFRHLLFISRAYYLSEDEEALFANPSTRGTEM